MSYSTFIEKIINWKTVVTVEDQESPYPGFVHAPHADDFVIEMQDQCPITRCNSDHRGLVMQRDPGGWILFPRVFFIITQFDERGGIIPHGVKERFDFRINRHRRILVRKAATVRDGEK